MFLPGSVAVWCTYSFDPRLVEISWKASSAEQCPTAGALCAKNTRLANICGLCALTVPLAPAENSVSNMPAGLQVGPLHGRTFCFIIVVTRYTCQSELRSLATLASISKAWPYCSSCCTPCVDVTARPIKQQQQELTAPGWPLQLMGPAGADAAILALGVAAEPWLDQPSLEVGLFLGREH